jgi:hypothetical protein
MPLKMVGRAGRLLWGSRVVSEFAGWSAESDGPARLRVQVARHAPNPVYWEHHGPLQAELEVGPQRCRGTVDGLVEEPLAFTLIEQEEG